MDGPVLNVRTLILSDIHLGTPECKANEVTDLLERTRCEKLILNGDIIDGWSLLRKGGWRRVHTRFLRAVLDKMERQGVEVVYLRGNHDDVLAQFLPLRVHNLRIAEEHVHEALRGRYLVVHGDIFDIITLHHRYLAVLGHVGYQALLRLNQVYNRYRTLRGKEYRSLSRSVKARVKQAVRQVSRFEEHVQMLVKSRGCRGLIAGHVHTPANETIGRVHYLNSGDWVESLTALVEHFDGTFEIVTYNEFRHRLEAMAAAAAVRDREARLRPSRRPALAPA
jgi:UDP-2,3-diacylglucosamine pyrophosphatase LpxH